MDTNARPDRIRTLTIILIAALIFMLGVEAANAGWLTIPEDWVSSFLPITMKEASAETTTSRPLSVFSTIATTTGNAGGRTGMNQMCMSQDPDSHFCNLAEIDVAWINRGVRFLPPLNRAWVDNPSLGLAITYQATGAAATEKWSQGFVCNGWITGDDSAEGIWIDDNAIGINIEMSPTGQYIHAPCDQVHHVACCK